MLGFILAASLTVVRPDPSAAELPALARAAEVVPAVELPAGRYVYVESERAALGFGEITTPGAEGLVVYLLPSDVEQWWQGRSLLERVTVREPVFFGSDDRDRYFASELPEIDGVGLTTETAFTDVAITADPASWPTELDALADRMDRAVASRGDDPRPLVAAKLELVQELLSPERLAPPQVRAGLIRYLDSFTEREVDRVDLGIAVGVTYDDPGRGRTTMTMTFDASGYLVAVEQTLVVSDVPGIPDGTVIAQLTQSPPRIAAEPGVRP